MNNNEKLIFETLMENFNDNVELVNYIINNSTIIQYLEKKTKAINKTGDTASKSRFSFANIYAIYVLTEDYINVVDNGIKYEDYDGMAFTNALAKVRSLPFGAKLQNHALNSRCNDEFKKYFPSTNLIPIRRNLITKKYWIEDKLLLLNYKGTTINLSESILDIVNNYVDAVSAGLTNLINTIKELKTEFEKNNDANPVINFIVSQLRPEIDARTFEIVAFAILKYYYKTTKIYMGYTKDEICEVVPELFKTGRTNANDGGIDYILKPLGKVFQVTEVLDFNKYTLDIDKLNHYSIVFVVKTNLTKEDVKQKIVQDAVSTYSDKKLIDLYLNCFEDIITINELMICLKIALKNGYIAELLNEIAEQTLLEYNMITNSL